VQVHVDSVTQSALFSFFSKFRKIYRYARQSALLKKKTRTGSELKLAFCKALLFLIRSSLHGVSPHHRPPELTRGSLACQSGAAQAKEV